MTTSDNPLPVLFVSHGAPDLLLTDEPAVEAIKSLTNGLPTPRFIVVVSAHWMRDPVGVTGAGALSTIHDFGGFPAALYQMQYPAQGDAACSDNIVQTLQARGVACRIDERRGLDHGAWIPLKLMYPAADIPVAQVSLPNGSLTAAVRLGEALQPLRAQGALILGSGGTVHNLRELRMDGLTDAWAADIDEWVRRVVEQGSLAEFVEAKRHPAAFAHAHPTLEHFAPLVVAWAAAGSESNGRRVHQSFTYGNLPMSCFAFP